MLTTARSIFLALISVLLMAAVCTGHPMGNFSISHHATITADGDTLRIKYLLDFAEIPTASELRAFDADKDGHLSAAEATLLLAAKRSGWVSGLSLSAEGKSLPLTLDHSEAHTRPGAANLPTLLVSLELTAPLPAGGEITLKYADDNYPDRTGWSEVVTPRDAGTWTLVDSSASTADQTQGLSVYPPDATTAPPNVRSATVRYRLGAATTQSIAAATTHTTLPPPAARTGTPADAFTRLIRPGPVSGMVLVVSLAIAVGMGAVHALSPGHGKTVVAAYLVGSRGTALHALLLGAVVTITHTAGVIALGVVVYFAGNSLPERVYPWLSFVSGLLILCLGVHQFSRRVVIAMGYQPPRDPHDPTNPGGHSHAMPAKVTPGALIALGVSGGLLPCPSALVVLLGAISLGKTLLGLALVVAFSVGLAATLSAIGLTLVYAKSLIAARKMEFKLAPKLAMGSAALLVVVGVVLSVTSLIATGAVFSR